MSGVASGAGALDGQPDAAVVAEPPGGPLRGVRVVDMASLIAGPGAARHLADLGADVVKVEPPGGDPLRRMGWGEANEAGSYYWRLVGRNKRSIMLDLKTEHGRSSLVRLVDASDLLIENLRPGKLEALGLDPVDLLSRNPHLVILRVTGFGQTGPYAGRPGFATIAEAMSGLSAISGEAAGPPLLPPVALTDEVAALAGAFAALAGLWHAQSTGEGQVIDLSLIGTVLELLGPLPSAFADLGYEQPRMGSALPYSVPRGTYKCSDGSWIAISASSDSVAWRLLTLIGLDVNGRFSTFQARAEHRDEIETALSRWIACRSSDVVLSELGDADAAVAPVYTMANVLADPHLVSQGAFVEVDGTVMQSVLARFGRSPGAVRFAGRQLDADRESIEAEFGLLGGPGDDGAD